MVIDTVSIIVYRSGMSYIAERRGEEKERRRAEILDAAEALYAQKGWDALTVDQVARSARLSRALVYVYFRDKEELLFAIGERAMRVMRDRFVEAAASQVLGLDKVEAIGRSYMVYAHEFPHYFDFCSRFQAHSVATEPGPHEDACHIAGDALIRRTAHEMERFLDPAIGQDIKEGGLSELDAQSLLERVVEDGVAGGVGKVGDHDCIFLGEWRSVRG